MIYLDHHATTPCDRRVVDAMIPWLVERFGNPHSLSHAFGVEAADVVRQSIEQIAHVIDAPPDSVIVTSGATESVQLALRGVCTHPRQRRRHLVTATTEHAAVLDVVRELEREGFRVTRVPTDEEGTVDPDRLEAAIDEDTAVVSVMWANNEVGTIAPMRRIADTCHRRGTLLHSDATQAVGRIDVPVRDTDVDLVSASAHKFYGPKGIGFLVAGNGNRRVRLKPQIVGGGQQRGLRGGTMNPAAIVAMATALRVAAESMSDEADRAKQLRDQLWGALHQAIDGLRLNGPPPDSDRRLPGNLNLTLPDIEGSAWMAATPEVAFSSGSACSTAEERPSHVLTAIGRTESEARRAVRFGIGRGNTKREIDDAARMLSASYRRLSGGN